MPRIIYVTSIPKHRELLRQVPAVQPSSVPLDFLEQQKQLVTDAENLVSSLPSAGTLLDKATLIRIVLMNSRIGLHMRQLAARKDVLCSESTQLDLDRLQKTLRAIVIRAADTMVQAYNNVRAFK